MPRSIKSEVYGQTAEWNRRLRKLTKNSPQKDWDWIIGHYRGDQDDLDHILNPIEEGDC